MFFTYPAATTSLKAFGRRWCSKLYLRSAWVSSPSAAADSASVAPARATVLAAEPAEAAPGSVVSEPSATRGRCAAGASAGELSCAGWAEGGEDGEVSECFPHPTGTRARAEASSRRGVMLESNSEPAPKNKWECDQPSPASHQSQQPMAFSVELNSPVLNHTLRFLRR